MPDTSPAQTLANAQIDPIAEWADAERGRKKKIVERVQSLAGESPPGRTLIELWLHPDHSKRTNPTLPNGLLLMKAAKEVMAEYYGAQQ